MMFSSLLLSVLLSQSGALGQPPATPPSPPAGPDWLVIVAAPVYQPDGGVMSETVPLPASGAGLVHVFARRSLCEPSTTAASEPTDAGFGWRVASQIISRSDRDIVVTVNWRRLWDAGRKVSNGPGGTVQLTLHPGDRIPLDHIVNASPTAECRAVGLGLEVRLGRAAAARATAATTIPLGATPGGAKPVDAEFWLIHTLPSGAEHVTHQVVRVPAAGGRFGFAPASVGTSRGELRVQLTGSIDRYRTPSGGEFLVLSMTRLVTGGGLPAAGIQATTAVPMAMPVPADVLEFKEFGMSGGRGRGGAGGGGTRGGGGGGAAGAGGGAAGGASAGGAMVARSGGGGRGGAAAASPQVNALLEGHLFALRMKVTQVN